jgi:hypothetical protein
MEQGASQLVKNSRVMETGVSLPHSLEATTCPCCEPDELNPIFIPRFDKPI